MSTGQSQPSEEELRAAYEAEIKKVRVEHLLVEHVVTLVNLGMRRTGLAPGTEPERDPAQVRLAIEAIRAALPLIEQSAPAQARPIRDALSQLQLAFVRTGGAPPPEASGGAPEAGAATAAPAAGTKAGEPHPSEGARAGAEPPGSPPPKPGEPGPAQRSGRLWVPGR